MQNINVTCQICGKGYHRCGSCKNTAHYKNVVDTPECFGIYCVLHEYREGIIDKNKAATKLKGLNIDNKNLLAAVSRDVKKILESQKVNISKKNIKEEE